MMQIVIIWDPETSHNRNFHWENWPDYPNQKAFGYQIITVNDRPLGMI